MDFLSETTYVDQAERVIDKLLEPIVDKRTGRSRQRTIVSTSKMRNILSMAADIYDNVMRSSAKELSQDIVARIEYLRVRMIYESGRESTVKSFIDEAKLLDYVKMIGNDKNKYILFYRYLEALVAFRKFKGGKDE